MNFTSSRQKYIYHWPSVCCASLVKDIKEFCSTKYCHCLWTIYVQKSYQKNIRSLILCMLVRAQQQANCNNQEKKKRRIPNFHGRKYLCLHMCTLYSRTRTFPTSPVIVALSLSLFSLLFFAPSLVHAAICHELTHHSKTYNILVNKSFGSIKCVHVWMHDEKHFSVFVFFSILCIPLQNTWRIFFWFTRSPVRLLTNFLCYSRTVTFVCPYLVPFFSIWRVMFWCIDSMTEILNT